MEFSNITSKNGLIQSCESWGGFQDGDISGDDTLLKQFTSRINRRLERYLGMLGGGSRKVMVDDINYTEHPFSTFTITDEQHDYEFTEDQDGNAISDIIAILVKRTAAGSFKKLDKLSHDDKEAALIMSGDTGRTGTPTKFLERDNSVFFDPKPDFTLAAGGKVFYKRVPSYFLSTDTTKKPGIPFQFHEMLAVAGSYDWLLVHKSNNTVEITRIEKELDRWEKEWRTYISLRAPEKGKITIKQENNR